MTSVLAKTVPVARPSFGVAEEGQLWKCSGAAG